MDDLTAIASLSGVLIGTIVIVLVIYRWYTSTTLYQDGKRKH